MEFKLVLKGARCDNLDKDKTVECKLSLAEMICTIMCTTESFLFMSTYNTMAILLSFKIARKELKTIKATWSDINCALSILIP